MSPVAPFFSEWLYRNLSEPVREKARRHNTPLRHDSVHLTALTVPEEDKIDLALEQRMNYAQRISSLVLSLRKKQKIRVRQPLQKILLPILDPSFQEQVERVRDLILSEVNVKEIEYLTDASGVIQKRVKPNFKTLGRRLGKDMKAAAEIIANLSNEEIARIEREGGFTLEVNGNRYELSLEDLEITAEDIPGLLVASDGLLTVALDITLTDSLLAEGTARELVNRIQNIRKNKDFNVTDRVRVLLEKHEKVEPAVLRFGDYIKNEVLATHLDLVENLPDGERIELPDGLQLSILVDRSN